MIALALGFAFVAQGGLSHSKAELISSVRSFAPGKPFQVGLHFTMSPGWHVYWRNPGDSGQEVRVKWSLPTGWKVQGIQWPTPQVIEDAGIVNYGYEGHVTLVATLVPPAKAGVAKIAANLSWLVCDDEMCLPAKGAVNLTLPSSKDEIPNPSGAAALANVAPKLPVRKSLEMASAVLMGKRIEFKFVAPSPGLAVTFFPYDADVVASGRYEVPKIPADRRVGITLGKSEFFNPKATRLRGILVAPSGSGQNRGFVAEIDLPLTKQTGGHQ